MISLVLAALLQVGAPAGPESPAQAQAAAAGVPAKADKPKAGDMVCKKEPVLGSRMKTRICMTQGEWDARQMQDRQDLDKAQQQIPQKAG